MADTSPKPFVFVLMPFGEEFEDVYKLGIKPACEGGGAYAERVDEQIFRESILQRIYNQIAKADIIVADMTGRNPNVFYETGYAHALGKHVILLTQKAEDIPFDLKHYPHIVYGGKIIDLIPELERRLRWAIEHPKDGLPISESQVQFYVEGLSLSDNPTIDYPVPTSKIKYISLKIDANNSGRSSIRSLSFQLAILTSDRISESDILKGEPTNIIKSPEGGHIHLPPGEIRILPGRWESIRIRLIAFPYFDPGEEESVTIRASSDTDVRDYPFRLRFVQSEDQP